MRRSRANNKPLHTEGHLSEKLFDQTKPATQTNQHTAVMSLDTSTLLTAAPAAVAQQWQTGG
jgi:hypothetical protein